MKSLSILILLGTVTALIIGGIFAVSPVFAQIPSESAPVQNDNNSEEAVAPVTGNLAVAEQAISLSADIAEVSEEAATEAFVSTFSVGLDKDWTAQATLNDVVAAQAAFDVEAQASLAAFTASVSTGQANQVTGIYVEGILANLVRRQPQGNPAFVSEVAGEVTQFGLAAQYGTQAFLAHNYLAGASFFDLQPDMIITLVFGDGAALNYRIADMHRYQALSPESTQSSFIDLETGAELSTSSLFHTVYNNQNSVVLQTCIENEGISSWGRIFVEAVPATDDEVKEAHRINAAEAAAQTATNIEQVVNVEPVEETVEKVTDLVGNSTGVTVP
jgi:hypothetical protein